MREHVRSALHRTAIRSQARSDYLRPATARGMVPHSMTRCQIIASVLVAHDIGCKRC